MKMIDLIFNRLSYLIDDIKEVLKKKGVALKGYYQGASTVCIFPYVRTDNNHTSFISILNNSDNPISVPVTFRDTNGMVVDTWKKALKPHECYRFTKNNFTGSVDIMGYWNIKGAECMLEIRENSGKGIGLAESAGSPHLYGPPWFYHLGVVDNGPGMDRTTIITHNFKNKPIYIFYSIGYMICKIESDGTVIKQWVGSDVFEVAVPARGLHIFKPFDVTKKPLEGDLYVGANTGPNNSGKQTTSFTGALFYKSHDDIDIHNYKPAKYPYTSSHAKNPEHYYIYLADVSDDGVNRNDRIYVKATSNKSQYLKFPVHFYDTNGDEIQVATPTDLDLYGFFDHPDSYSVMSPKKMLNKAFKGSIWIEHPQPQTDWFGHLNAVIHKGNAPGERSLCDASPGRGTNCIPYISNKDVNWNYKIIIFYPEASYKKAPPGPKDDPPPYGGPTTPPPVVGGGWVVLTLHEVTGKPMGWATVKMSPNETQTHTLDSLFGNLLSEPCEGSLQIEPREVVVLLEIENKNTKCRGCSGSW